MQYQTYNIEKVKKATFVANKITIVENNNKFIEILSNVVEKVITQFSGKVINKRLTNAIINEFNFQHEDNDMSIYCSLDFSYHNNKCKLNITFNPEKFGYDQRIERSIYVYYDSDIRLLLDKTISEINELKNHITNWNNDIKIAIEQYDTYLEQAKKLDEQITNFLNSCPYGILENITFSNAFAIR